MGHVSLCCSEPYFCGTHHRETVILLKTYLKGSLMKLQKKMGKETGAERQRVHFVEKQTGVDPEPPVVSSVSKSALLQG